MRLNMNVDDNLIADVDAYASKMHITRTAAVAVLLSQALSANAGMEALTQLNGLIQSPEGLQRVLGGSGAMPQIGGKAPDAHDQ